MNPIIRQISALGWKRTFLIFFTVWLIVFFFTALQMTTTLVSNQDTMTADRLYRTLMELELLRKQNDELLKNLNIGGLKLDEKEVIENLKMRLTKANRTVNKIQDFGYVYPKEEPNLQYEVYRRRITTNVKEFGSYINTELTSLQTQLKFAAPDLMKSVSPVLNLAAQHKRLLLHDLQTLAEVDGYATWREKESNDLHNLVQTRFKTLQNPKDCKTAKKLVCHLERKCGFSCQIHHVTYCFLMAYGTERTLILNSTGWKYHKGGWNEVFKPLSETCTDSSGESTTKWPGTPDTQVLILPILDLISPRPRFLPLAVPEDLAPRLIRIHGDPIVWWIGQILKYLLRPQHRTSNLIQETIDNMGFQRPIVGVHVRRTDKIRSKEASFHGIEEYMTYVDEYYNQLELKQKVNKRRIYLATDDPKVISDATFKYPNYEVLGDPDVAKTAAASRRYSSFALDGIISDVHMLSMCDYIVCTFSSTVCRLAYGLMQNYFPDAADKVQSLDEIYYFGGQRKHKRIAVIPHEAQQVDELNMQVGDLIGIAGNHWNGFSKGTNLRTRQVGLYPSFKVKDKVEVAKFPTYPEASETQDEIEK